MGRLRASRPVGREAIRTMTRRAFVSGASAAAAALLLAGCGSSAPDSAAKSAGLGAAVGEEKTADDPIASSESVPSQLEESAAVSEAGPSSLPAGFRLAGGVVELNNGIAMPANGLGTYSLKDQTCIDSVTAALERGVRLIDTAHIYGNEVEVGRAVRSSDVPREDVFVITKLYPSQFANAEAAIEEALAKLDIGAIDMMLLHHPGAGDVEAYRAMERAYEAGKLRSIGLSCYYVDELAKFLPEVSVTPALIQNEIHPYYQDVDVVPFIHEQGIAVQAWYPLGGRGHNTELLSDPVLGDIAAARGVSIPQVILRWDLQRGVIVIPGASNPDHILEDTHLYDFELSESEMAAIAALDRHEKHDWY